MRKLKSWLNGLIVIICLGIIGALSLYTYDVSPGHHKYPIHIHDTTTANVADRFISSDSCFSKYMHYLDLQYDYKDMYITTCNSAASCTTIECLDNIRKDMDAISIEWGNILDTLDIWSQQYVTALNYESQ